MGFVGRKVFVQLMYTGLTILPQYRSFLHQVGDADKWKDGHGSLSFQP